MKNESAVNEMVAFCEAVLADAVQCLEELSKSSTEFWIRMTIRSSASCIEGISTVLADAASQIMCNSNQSKEVTLEIAQKVMILTNRSPDISDTGTLKPKKWNVRTVQYIIFSFRCILQLQGISDDEICSKLLNKDFQDTLSNLFTVRNRITHPKMTDSICVTDTDKKIAIKTMANIIKLLHALKGTARSSAPTQ